MNTLYDVINLNGQWGFWVPPGVFETYPNEEYARQVSRAVKRAAGICLHCGRKFDE